MAGCCRAKSISQLASAQTFCDFLEEQGARLPLKVVRTSVGIQFEVSWAGRVFELFGAVKAFDCRKAQGRAVRALEPTAAILQALAEPLEGKTTTLGRVSLLR